MRSQNKALRRRRRGVSVLLVGGMSIVVFPMVGLSVDVGILYVIKTKLSAAVDSAVLSGARALRRGGDVTTQAANAQTTSLNYFRANFPSDFPLATGSSIVTTVTQVSANVRQVQATATAQVPIAFLGMLPNAGPTVTVAATATALRRDANLVLVLDRSGSLAASGSCGPMKAAAAGFVDMFSEQRDNLGLVTFATSSYYLDYPLANNFKSASPSLPQVINKINCFGGTSSAMGLWNGYTALANLASPGALNVIVFFTDGQPTALSADFPTNSPCAPTPKLGVLTTTLSGSMPISPNGLFNLSNGPVPIRHTFRRETADNRLKEKADAVCTDDLPYTRRV